MMDKHIETIECPSCRSIERAIVWHEVPWHSYVHDCRNCGYLIMESEWNRVDLFDKGLGRLINQKINYRAHMVAIHGRQMADGRKPVDFVADLVAKNYRYGRTKFVGALLRLGQSPYPNRPFMDQSNGNRYKR